MTFHSRWRPCLAAVVLPLAGLAPAYADEPAATPEATAAAPAVPAMRVVRDPVTGKLRAPEHDEVQAAPGAAQRGLRAAPSPMQRLLAAPRDVRLSDGTRARTIDASRLSFSVVSRDADGRIEARCVQGESAADHALHAPAAVKPEDRHAQ